MQFQEDTIKNFVAKAESYKEFSDEDKNFWKEKVNLLAPEQAFFMLELFENSPEDILRLNDSLREKLDIVKSGTKEDWQKLLNKEKDELNKINETGL